MPGFDKSGPMGDRPRTGGARGGYNLASTDTCPTHAGNWCYGRRLAFRRNIRGSFDPGYGQGRGYGRGCGRYWNDVAPVFPVYTHAEIELLRAQAVDIQNSLDSINKRIDELEKEPTEKS